MKHLLKLAMGAALAGTLVNMLLKKQQQAGNKSTDSERSNSRASTSDGPNSSYDQNLSSLGAMGSGGDMDADGTTAANAATDVDLGTEGKQRGYGENPGQAQSSTRPQNWSGAPNVF